MVKVQLWWMLEGESCIVVDAWFVLLLAGKWPRFVT